MGVEDNYPGKVRIATEQEIFEHNHMGSLSYGDTTFSFKKPLDPNWEYTFGKAEECISFRANYETPPNRLQRWLCGKILGMHWKEL